jgi:hypothetical protein
VGIVVDSDPIESLPELPFKTKRDSCDRDRFDGMLLKIKILKRLVFRKENFLLKRWRCLLIICGY